MLNKVMHTPREAGLRGSISISISIIVSVTASVIALPAESGHPRNRDPPVNTESPLSDHQSEA
jgi:hypothetical protein